jgi:FAD:protein FMN transferase
VSRLAVPLTHLRDGYWTERRVRAMGSTAHIVLGDAPDGLSAWAVDELERLEQSWSRFRPDSELTRLHERDGAWTSVSNVMLLALTCAAHLHRATEGRFDPTIRTALERNGYDRSFELVESSTVPTPVARAAPGFARVVIDAERSRVRVPSDVQIDLGGIGKGLAADIVARGLIDRGARSALVGLGGDLRAHGRPPGRAWEIPVTHPGDESRVAFEWSLAAGGLVTSTTTIRSWTRGDRTLHHIVDPATGNPADSEIRAVVAAAPEAWWAEGIAKAVLIAGLEHGPALARRSNVHAWLFRADDHIVEIAS